MLPGLALSATTKGKAGGLRRLAALRVPAALTRRKTVVSAHSDDERDKIYDDQLRKAIERLRRDGVDEKIARKVLKTWDAQNVKDPSSLRDNLFKKGVSAVGFSVVQLVTDAIAAYCSTATATMFSQSDMTGSDTLSYIFQAIFIYFAIGVVFDLYRLGAVIGTAATFGGDSQTLYAAVTEVAGQTTGLGIVDKANAAVSSTKIVLALNSVRRVLRDELDGAQFTSGTLAQLNAYFVLQHAERTYGWSLSDVEGLTKEDAAIAASIFSKYDANEDYKLEMFEFKRLCDEAEFTLTEPEVKAAMSLLDKRASGFVEFDEFVAWWAGQQTPTPALQN